jgi:hypothetical protein
MSDIDNATEPSRGDVVTESLARAQAVCRAAGYDVVGPGVVAELDGQIATLREQLHRAREAHASEMRAIANELRDSRWARDRIATLVRCDNAWPLDRVVAELAAEMAKLAQRADDATRVCSNPACTAAIVRLDDGSRVCANGHPSRWVEIAEVQRIEGELSKVDAAFAALEIRDDSLNMLEEPRPRDTTHARANQLEHLRIELETLRGADEQCDEAWNVVVDLDLGPGFPSCDHDDQECDVCANAPRTLAAIITYLDDRATKAEHDLRELAHATDECLADAKAEIAKLKGTAEVLASTASDGGTEANEWRERADEYAAEIVRVNAERAAMAERIAVLEEYRDHDHKVANDIHRIFQTYADALDAIAGLLPTLAAEPAAERSKPATIAMHAQQAIREGDRWAARNRVLEARAQLMRDVCAGKLDEKGRE